MHVRLVNLIESKSYIIPSAFDYSNDFSPTFELSKIFSEMEHPVCHLNDINGDVLGDIMARSDGLTMAAAACACSGLRDAARDQRLWRQLCHSTWPSTALPEAGLLISSATIGGYDKFYANSFPLIAHGKSIHFTDPKNFKCPELKTQVSASHFASLVDIFYKKDCVFSKVMDGIPQATDANDDKGSECSPNVSTDDCRRWYSNCPFKLELLSLENDEGTGFEGELGYADNEDEDHDLGHNANDEERRGLLAMAVAENGDLRHDHSKELEENLRLSWVLLDKKNGTTVNLSSWKPLLVQRSWPFNGDYVLHSGSIIPVEDSLLHHKLAKCKIIIRCKPTESGGRPNWREISMQIEDITGASVGGSKSLVALNHALDCLRSTNHLEVEKGYRQYEKKQREVMRKKEFQENFIGGFYVSVEVAVFVTLCYFCLFF